MERNGNKMEKARDKNPWKCFLTLNGLTRIYSAVHTQKKVVDPLIQTRFDYIKKNTDYTRDSIPTGQLFYLEKLDFFDEIVPGFGVDHFEQLHALNGDRSSARFVDGFMYHAELPFPNLTTDCKLTET